MTKIRQPRLLSSLPALIRKGCHVIQSPGDADVDIAKGNC